MATYRYVGKGFIPGIPTRSLSEEEAKRYGVTKHPLYVRDEPDEPEKPARSRRRAEPVSEFDTSEEGDE